MRPMPEHLKYSHYTARPSMQRDGDRAFYTVRVNSINWRRRPFREDLRPLEQLWPHLTDEDRHALTMLALIEYEPDPTQMMTKILHKMNGWTLFADGEMQSASRPVVSQVSA